ncbi:TlpA family protein disulfide reductase [Cochleicola gelatinilyticus]|uniref:Thiol-disulfide oxidoreductase n=1 Tax=Cochleicola gelatinilyticus TaxID=1763537 RepID=A0A167H428_9FLAO|nr:redoxin domain-containing protein [Cochleicola gelatinilyticus]OAB78194.1 thiol-disulfide oxidoreductase [Cochleicola gelatinilyticus]
MGTKLLTLFILFSFTLQAQDMAREDYFSQKIGKHIKKFTQESQRAYADNNLERAEFLFDSLINNVVNGSYLDNFKVKKLSGKKSELNDFKKPVFLITYASWCVPGVGEIPALNDLVAEHHDEIDFVVLFWDSKDKVKKATKEYHKKINVMYVDEKENTNNHVVKTMKHSLGFPTSFYIDSNKRILDVQRGVLHAYNESYDTSFNMNYDSFLNGVATLKSLSPNTNLNPVATKIP